MNLPEMPARVQAKLHRVLRDREVDIARERRRIELDIRPITAVEPGFEAVVDEGRLRRDLYERLSLIRIELPPLRQRREDVPFLVNHFLKEICRAGGMPLKTLTRSGVTLLAALPWRGNAPELRAILERLVLLTPHGSIRLEDVLSQVRIDGSEVGTAGGLSLRDARLRFERDYIAAVCTPAPWPDGRSGSGAGHPADEPLSQAAAAQCRAAGARSRGARAERATWRAVRGRGCDAAAAMLPAPTGQRLSAGPVYRS